MLCATCVILSGERPVFCAIFSICAPVGPRSISRPLASPICANILALIPQNCCGRSSSGELEERGVGGAREREREGAAQSFVARHPDASAVRLHDCSGYEQSQPDARILPAGGVAHAVETLEDMVNIFGTDPDALVCDAHQVLVILLL